MNALGLTEDVLKTHIAWDIGANAVAQMLAERLRCDYFACEFSRLVVDVNRSPEANDVIPDASDGVVIAGNSALSDDARQTRIANYHAPYHAALTCALSELERRHRHPFVISVHSYTPRLRGICEDRPWPVGLLWREDSKSAYAMMDCLRTRTDWTIGDNQPYDARLFNYSVDRHIGPRAWRHLTLEIRQDYLMSRAQIAEMAETLAESIVIVASLQ